MDELRDRNTKMIRMQAAINRKDQTISRYRERLDQYNQEREDDSMADWMTTGQMIDRLNAGGMAKNEEGTYVKKSDNGGLYECYLDGSARELIRLVPSIANSEWRIIPQSVSFEKALDAFKNGKTVSVYQKKVTDGLLFHESIYYPSDNMFKTLDWDDIINGYWVIEDD